MACESQPGTSASASDRGPAPLVPQRFVADEYTLSERAPTLDEYRRLCDAVGWGTVEPAALEIGLRHSLFAVCVLHQGEVIGCGRIVGDGGMYFYIQDIVVLPEFQGRGIGRRIMGAVMGYLQAHARAGAFIGLMAARGASGFYEKYGFVQRPTEQYGPGMFLIWQ
jgi:ribosomal protein S18 acetylase RimI-like enzyme